MFVIFKPLHLFVILIIFVSACKSSKDSAVAMEKENPNPNVIAEGKLGEDFSEYYNSDTTMILYKKATTSKSDPRHGIKYIVIDLGKNIVAHEGKVGDGEVEWYDNTRLKITKYLGISSREHPNGINAYLFDVVKKKRSEYIDSSGQSDY